MHCREFSADLGLSAWPRQQPTFTSLLQSPRCPCLPAMIDGPILNLPSSFQRVKYFYFSFLDQCFFPVRKCSAGRVLDLSRDFPYNSFISDACGAEIHIVTLTSIFEILKINNMPAAREQAIRGKKVSLLCFNISIIRGRMK